MGGMRAEILPGLPLVEEARDESQTKRCDEEEARKHRVHAGIHGEKRWLVRPVKCGEAVAALGL